MMKTLVLVGCVLVLFIQASIQIRLAALDTPTTDEPVHLSAGYTYLTRHDYRFNPEHPPLIKTLAALPLLWVKPVISSPAEAQWDQSTNFFYDSWRENRAFGEMLLYQSDNNPDQLIFLGRLPMIAVTFLLGLTVLLIAWRHWGPWSALVATTFFAFDPTVNAHGHLVTTDVGLSLGFLLSVYSTWRLLDRPTWRNGLYLGLSFGLALISKHTAIIFLPFLVVALLWAFWLRFDNSYRWSVLAKVGVAFIVSMIVIWASFGFHDRSVPATSSITTSISEAKNQISEVSAGHAIAIKSTVDVVNAQDDSLYRLIRPLLLLLPGDYLKGLGLVLGHTSNGQSSFLLGQTSNTGWWYYFPLLFLLKTPLPTLIAVFASFFLLWRFPVKDRLAQTLVLGAVVFLGAACLSKANLGIRHILPVYPLLFLGIGWAASLTPKIRLTAFALAVWLLIIYIATFPNYLGYFNELAGSSAQGYKIATDSNLDWGQDLKRIGQYLDDNNIQNPYVEYGWLGNSALNYYLGSYRLLSDYQSGDTGTAIIGASAYNQLSSDLLSHCFNLKEITPGVLTCQLRP